MSASNLAAQVQDVSRIVVGLSAGVTGRVGLYDVAQPIVPTSGANSVLQLHRGFRSDVTASGRLIWFPNSRVGLGVEFTYLGAGTIDLCTLAHDGGNIDIARACAALDGKKRSPTTSEVQTGLTLRPLPMSVLQPYLNLQGGVAFTPSSTVYTISEYTGAQSEQALLTVFKDDSSHSFRPSWTVAAGISTAPVHGYQIRVEARESWMRVDAVAGPTSQQGLTPPIRKVIVGFPSVVVGFDIVLGRTRGRRY